MKRNIKERDDQSCLACISIIVQLMVRMSGRLQCYTFSSWWSLASLYLAVYIINHRALSSEFYFKHCRMWWPIVYCESFQCARDSDWSFVRSNYSSAKCNRLLCFVLGALLFLLFFIYEYFILLDFFIYN